MYQLNYLKNMKVSVIIPVFNRPVMVLKAIDSVLNQTWKELELIVVDDGSTDNTFNVIKSIKDDRLKLLHQEHKGVSAARNYGIKESCGDFIAFLDSDDYWLKEKLEKQMSIMLKDKDCLLIHTEEIWFKNGRRHNPKEKHKKREGDIFEQSLKLCSMSIGTILVRRKVFDLIGVFDESFTVCEDYDLWLRFTAFFNVRLIPEPLVVRTGGHPDQLSQRFRGMDKFRIKSILKILNNPELDRLKRIKAYEELKRKCFIYGHGCRKRFRYGEALYYLSLPFMVN